MVVQLLITRQSLVQYPITVDEITLTQYRRGTPGKLTFSIIKDDLLDVQEGDSVLLLVDSTPVFYGFVFEKSRSGGNPKVDITAYDQIRYLKNKDTFTYSATADELVRMIASQYQLRVGTLEPTAYRLSRVEDNETLLDIVEAALDETVQHTGALYVLYDACGSLMLKKAENLRLPLLIDASQAGAYTYKSSIDKRTYNTVKVVDGAGHTYVAKDAEKIRQWGTLQLTENVQSANGGIKAAALLRLYGDKMRTLTLQSVIGDTRVRAGCSVIVRLSLGDAELQNWMLVEQATHKFKGGMHLMDLKVRGGGIVV